MTEKEWMQEGIDLKLYALLLMKKLWLIIVTGIVAAAAGMSLYYIQNVALASAPEYEAFSRYYLTFAYDKDGDVYDHYNAYTWNDLAASDPILDYTVSKLPNGYEKEDVKNAVTCTMPSDYRVITTSAVTDNPEKSMEIAKATEQSLQHFGEIMPEFSKIEVIAPAEVSQVLREDYTVKTGLVWGAFGVIGALFVLLFCFVLDTSVYLPETSEEKYGYPALGVVYRNGQPEKALKDNLNYLPDGHYRLLCMQQAEAEEVKMLAGMKKDMEFTGAVEEAEDFAAIRRSDGVILAVRYGCHNGSLLKKQTKQLEKLGCTVKGLILYHADETLYKRYYHTSLKKGK